MEKAVLLASIFGPILTILGVWVFFHTNSLRMIWRSLEEDRGALFLGGVLNLLIGFTVFSMYREWSMHLAVFVTLFGYVHIIRGLLVLFATDWVLGLTQRIITQTSLRAMSLIPIIWGLALMKLGFMS